MNYVYRDDDGWHAELVTSSAISPRLALSPRDDPHVLGVRKPELLYFFKDGGSWKEEVIVESIGGTDSLALWVDVSGAVHVTFEQLKEDAMLLQHAWRRSGGKWDVEPVRETDPLRRWNVVTRKRPDGRWIVVFTDGQKIFWMRTRQ